MNISTKDVVNTPKYGESPYIKYGTGEYKINSLEVVTASTGSMKVRMNMESRPITTPLFEGVDGALGKVGRVDLTSYMKPGSQYFDKSIETLQRKVSEIADALGVREAVNEVQASSIPEYVAKVSPLLCNKFTNWKVSAEEYLGTDKEGKEIVKHALSAGLYGFVSSDASKLTFSMDNKYDYKKVETGSETPVDEGSTSDIW